MIIWLRCIAWLSWGWEFGSRHCVLCVPARDVMPFPLKHFKLSEWGPVSQREDCGGHRDPPDNTNIYLASSHSLSRTLRIVFSPGQNSNPTEDAGPRVWAAQSELWWVEVFPPSGNLINRRLFIDDLWLLLPDDTIWLEKWCYCLQSDYDHTWYFPTTEICLSKHFTHFRHRTDFNGQVHSLQKLSMLWQNSLSETG